ncbi:hypothetical protein [Bradyrhizobium sp. 6(2017)]|uniref:hypothetical protein n=1 Tax=Bradyrhizobium sp. 6(2017) TaxID=1197460 RepID=UPI0013E19E01|nr:hypothetical protein [Bradyrhizobium sp. 6(2017)]QIG97845.1 hypothetical protein G6P99_39825 [Bradyrhizobium sp. 6(2017)]
MRLVRVVVGFALLTVGLYVVIGEHFAGTSADATLNARLNIVRAPIEGRVTLAIKNMGARVSPGGLIAEIYDQRFDTARLLELDRDREDQRIELKRLAGQPRIAETKATQDAAAARLRQADAEFQRANELNTRGVQTAANLDRARATYDVAQQELESARQRVNYSETELASARERLYRGVLQCCSLLDPTYP